MNGKELNGIEWNRIEKNRIEYDQHKSKWQCDLSLIIINVLFNNTRYALFYKLSYFDQVKASCGLCDLGLKGHKGHSKVNIEFIRNCDVDNILVKILRDTGIPLKSYGNNKVSRWTQRRTCLFLSPLTKS